MPCGKSIDMVSGQPLTQTFRYVASVRTEALNHRTAINATQTDCSRTCSQAKSDTNAMTVCLPLEQALVVVPNAKS